MVKVSAPVKALMDEAKRRYETFGKRDGKTLADTWTGLGMPSEYKPGTQAGLFVPLHGRETPRVLNWYLLTEAGLALYKELYPE